MCQSPCGLNGILGMSWHFWKIREGLRPDFLQKLLTGQNQASSFSDFWEEVIINQKLATKKGIFQLETLVSTAGSSFDLNPVYSNREVLIALND